MANRKEAILEAADHHQSDLSLQQEALLRGMFFKKRDAVLDYSIDSRGNRVQSQDTLSREEKLDLIRKFRNNPKECLGYARENIFSIMQDKNLSQERKGARVKRYTDAYLDLIVRLDRKAFPAREEINRGVPEYVPDGLSDMGSDSETDPVNRSGREKIRVDKQKIFDQSKDLFYKIFSTDISRMDNEQAKHWIVQYVSYFVANKMPYDKKQNPFPSADRSIRLNESLEQQLAVCRHHALYAQVLLQTFGITSRLLKCDVDFGGGSGGAHAANLVRINNKWHILDITNPDIGKNGEGETFLRPIPEGSVDPNSKDYEWKFRRNDGEMWKYRSRNNMYYRIMDNRKK
jgi:hypothetical protein